MRWIAAIAREIIGLFVDDGGFAVGILIWLAVAVLVLPLVPLPLGWRGVTLFGGLAAILVWSCFRGASATGR